MKCRCFDVKVEEVVDIWNILKQNSIFSPTAESKFSKILLKLIKFEFMPSTNSEILNRLYLSPNFLAGQMSEESFNVYYELFLRVNSDARNIEMKHGNYFSRVSSKLIGFSCLINIIFLSNNNNIVQKSMKLLISLNIKVHKNLITSQEEI